MANRIVGIHVQEQTLPATVRVIQQADQAGVASAWLTSGGLGPDSLTTLAVAGTQTKQILLGSSIAVIYSRHPVAMIQQAIAVEQTAPGRFRLGIGTSHRPTIEGTYGLPFKRPAEHLREYTTILEEAFHGGELNFTGQWYSVHGRVPNAPPIPVYLAALRPALYELAGEIAQGAISWVSPSHFLRSVARPALLTGAAKQPGANPRLVGHALGLISDDPAAVKQAGRERLAGYARVPFYQAMFIAAGFPDAANGIIEDALIDDLVLTGNEEQFTRGIRRFLDAGCDELIISLLSAGPNPEASIHRTLKRLGERGF